MVKLELIMDTYHHFVPSVFQGSWYRLAELTPIHTAIRAKRLDVVQLLFKGLTPECNDTVMGRPLLSWDSSYWVNPDEDMKPAVRCRPNLFNVALAARSEGICFFLLKNPYPLKFCSRSRQTDADAWLIYLAFAEEYGMNRLPDALLDYAKERLKPREYQLLMRRMLLNAPKDGLSFEPWSLLPPGTLRPNHMTEEPDSDDSLPNKSPILDRLIERERPMGGCGSPTTKNHFCL